MKRGRNEFLDLEASVEDGGDGEIEEDEDGDEYGAST